MCFGVRDAIALAQSQAQQAPLTVLGDLVHNETVLADLRARGIRVVQRPEAVETVQVMITAHGASERMKGRARARGLNLLEATCPLVESAHRALAGLVQQGFHPVIIGKRGHVEVRGMTEDLESVDVLMTEAEVFELEERPRLGIVAQTTQPMERVDYLVGLVRWRFPKSEVRFVDTVCRPTKQRQSAAAELARQSTVVVVIGGAHSNNTHELVRTCARYCNRVHHILTAEELREEWFQESDVAGITAGTSTPDETIAAVENWLAALAERPTQWQIAMAEDLHPQGRDAFHRVPN
jgi:4-hydroxy-3-methylbut-2-en-1-yl diphosphate reductase